MAAALCRQCGGHGFDRGNNVCTLCAGSGRDPYEKPPGSGGPARVRGGRGNSVQIRASAQFAIIAAGLIVGFVIYRINGATDAATARAVLAFLGTVITGSVLVRVLGKPLPVILLAMIFLALDHFAFDGALSPRVLAVLSDLWAHVRGALLP